MRSVAEAIAACDPDVVCVHGIDPGDALALATRFARGYAYRGSQALLWKPAFAAREVHDRYLPGVPLRPFDRRGILQVDGAIEHRRCALVATQFSHERDAYVRELRFARRVVRSIDGAVAAFVAGMTPAVRAIGFADLGIRELAFEG
ncbi:MAG TPA: hypothetical protein VIJ64_11775, partial [Candidatus Lustribacter sp.]